MPQIYRIPLGETQHNKTLSELTDNDIKAEIMLNMVIKQVELLVEYFDSFTENFIHYESVPSLTIDSRDSGHTTCTSNS